MTSFLCEGGEGGGLWEDLHGVMFLRVLVEVSMKMNVIVLEAFQLAFG